MKDPRKVRLQQLLRVAMAKTESDGYSELARKMNIPIQAMGNYYRGDNCPNRENFLKIAEFLELTPYELDALLDGQDAVKLPTDTKKADDIIPVVLQLPDSEKFVLLKYLVNTLEYA